MVFVFFSFTPQARRILILLETSGLIIYATRFPGVRQDEGTRSHHATLFGLPFLVFAAHHHCSLEMEGWHYKMNVWYRESGEEVLTSWHHNEPGADFLFGSGQSNRLEGFKCRQRSTCFTARCLFSFGCGGGGGGCCNRRSRWILPLVTPSPP